MLLGEALLETIRLAVREEVRLAFREAKYGEDRLLNVEEVSKILSVPKSWLYGHASSLPFTRRLGKHLASRFKDFSTVSKLVNNSFCFLGRANEAAETGTRDVIEREIIKAGIGTTENVRE
jgi:hypothetical protein